MSKDIDLIYRQCNGKRHQIVNGRNFETVVWADNEAIEAIILIDFSIYDIEIVYFLFPKAALKISKKFINPSYLYHTKIFGLKIFDLMWGNNLQAETTLVIRVVLTECQNDYYHCGKKGDRKTQKFNTLGI